MDTRPYALIVHIFGFGMWVGNLATIAGLLAARDKETEALAKQTLAKLARADAKVADIGFTIALVGGIWLIAGAPGYYSNQPWMVLKLVLVMALLGAHALLRIKTKRAVEGEGTFPKPLLGILSVLALSIIALVILKPMARS